MWSFAVGFFHLACLSMRLITYHVSVFHSFLLLKNIPLSGYAIVYHCLPFTHQWTFGLFLLFGYCKKCCYEHLYTSLCTARWFYF